MLELLNSALALAKQAYDELSALVSLKDLAARNFGTPQQRPRVEELLKKLNGHIVTIQGVLSELIRDGQAPPVLSLPTTHRDFWQQSLSPNADLLRRSYFLVSGQELLAELMDFVSADDKPGSAKGNAISWGLERWSDTLEEQEQFEWLERGFDIDGAMDVIAMPWFEPDSWMRNLRSLEPVLVDRPTTVMRDHVRYRLLEIYRAFTFGLWMSAIALSRSLIEFSLRSNAPRFGVSVTYESYDGRREDKSLKRLGDELSSNLPGIAGAIEVVRDSGNRILHPKKHDVISHPAVMRAEALNCIKAAITVVSSVYSGAGNDAG